MNRFYIIVIPILVFLLIIELKAQRLEISDVFPETYPTIMLEFKVWDKDGNEVRNYSVNDMQVLENSISRAIQSVSCPPVGQTKFSLILTIDISYSMSEPSTIPGKTKMDVVREAARNAIQSLPKDSTRWEAAITLFDYENELIRDFTNSKWWLNKGLDTFLLNPRAGTDYNAAFLYSWTGRPGALLVARKAKYKPVIIFLTDGKHEGRASPPPSRVNIWVSEILDSAKKYNVTIYAITLGFPVPPELNSICTGTPYGQAYQSVPNQEELNNLYSNILNTIGTIGPPAPCRIRFISDCNGGNVQVVYKPLSVTDTFTYKIPKIYLPSLDVADRTINFYNQISPYEKIITLKARNNFVLVDPPGVSSPFNNITVTDWGGSPPPFKLDKDSTRTIKLSISPFQDSLFHSFNFNFVSSACDGNEATVNTGWIYAVDVDCGSGVVGQPKTIPQQTIFCNNWNEPITIYSVRISGGNESDFRILGGTTNITVQPLSCLKFDISFTPGDATNRESKLIFDTQKGRFESRIFGNGSGFPEIVTLSTLTFPDLDCKKPIYDTTIVIKNTGALNLEISKFEITGQNSSGFSFVPSNPGQVSIPPDGQYSLTIRCNPSTKGNLSATLVITSNAKNNPVLNIPITVFNADYSFTTNLDSYDFGFVCLNEEKTFDLEIRNTGNVDISISSVINQPFSILQATPIYIPKGSSTIVKVFVKSSSEGNYTTDVTFSDTHCNFTKKIQLKAIILEPKIDKQPIPISGVVGVPKDTSIQIKNITNRQLIVNSASFSDPQLVILSPNLPWTIAPMSSIQIYIRFNPQSSNALNAYLRLLGTPCNFSDSLLFTSNPIASRATIAIEKHQGLIGEIVTIPILIKNAVMLDKSGTTKVRTKINFDQNVLKFIGTNPNVSSTLGTNSILLDNIPFTPTTTKLIEVKFEVLNTGVLQTTLDVNSSQTIDGYIAFTEEDGLFEVLPSSAEISVGNIQANTGDEFQLPIYLKKPKNITNFHTSISTELSFNYSLMEPIGSTPKGSLDITNNTNTIKIDNLPVQPIGNDSAIALLLFKAKLGNSPWTDIIIQNTKTAKGFVNFIEKPGKLTLKNICESGGLRLFEPNPKTVISILTEPKNNLINLRFSPIELGLHRVVISDFLGNSLISLDIAVEGNEEQNIPIFINNFGEGVFILRIEGPTSIRTQKFLWLK
ncbi:MAG: choice-of-anchor D domain-containing protein [Ignavibacteria bacterium]|nr:choice-of-anchor D domain-containing protein [Ignavibacteria bacterium]